MNKYLDHEKYFEKGWKKHIFSVNLGGKYYFGKGISDY